MYVSSFFLDFCFGVFAPPPAIRMMCVDRYTNRKPSRCTLFFKVFKAVRNSAMVGFFRHSTFSGRSRQRKLCVSKDSIRNYATKSILRHTLSTRILVKYSAFQVYILAGHCTYCLYCVGTESQGVQNVYVCINSIPCSTTIGFWNIEIRSKKRRENTIDLLMFILAVNRFSFLNNNICIACFVILFLYTYVSVSGSSSLAYREQYLSRISCRA